MQARCLTTVDRYKTLHPGLFTAQTATLNLLAAYLVKKACELDDRATFRHVHCADAAPAPPPVGQENQATCWFQCGGEVIGVDKAIIRRGPDREAARAPFQDLLGDFAFQHERWLGRHGEGTLTWALSKGARDRFVRAARDYSLPLPRYQQEAMAERLPTPVQIQPSGQTLRWSGELGPDRIAEAWTADGNGVEIHCRAHPDQLGVVAMAVTRIAMHAQQTALVADVAAWHPFLEQVSTHSRHSEDLLAPAVRPPAGAGAIRNSQLFELDALYQTLQRSLDDWILAATHEHLEGLLRSGATRATVSGSVWPLS